MNETQELIASCDQLLAELNKKLARVADLLGDPPKAEQPAKPSYHAGVVYLYKIDGNNVERLAMDLPNPVWKKDINAPEQVRRDVPEISERAAKLIESALLGDAPKAEQPEPLVRWFYSPASTAMRKIVNGVVYCKFVDLRSDGFTEDVHSAESIIRVHHDQEITAEQADAILKGGRAVSATTDRVCLMTLAIIAIIPTLAAILWPA